MADVDDIDPAWPPGTVKLAQLLESNEKGSDIILQPTPTSDPNDPLNWSSWQKTIDYTLAAFYAMMVYAFVNATSPTWGPLADELGFSSTLLTNTYAIGCATLALGAPMLIPFALKFGSRSVYVLSSAAQLGVSIWAARTQTPGDWWGVNAVQCWLGSLCEVLVQLTIADIYFVHQRGMMNSIYIWAMNVGGNLAVVAAGFVTTDMGWRWVWWWFVIFFGVQLVVFTLGFEETKFRQDVTTGRGQGSLSPTSSSSPVDREHEEKKKTGEKAFPTLADPEANTGDTPNLTTVHIDSSIPRKTYLQRLSLTRTSPGDWLQFLRHSWQPFLILGSIPGVLYSSLVYAVLLAWNTVMTAASSTIMLEAPYEFTASQIGLMSLAPFVGQTLGSLICGPLSDWTVLYLARRNNGIYEPEFRFYLFLPFVPFQLAGAWWFGYALNNGSSWVQVAMAYGLCNFGSAPLQSLALTYVLDAYNEIVGDALTAVTFVRNTFSTIFVFAMPAWIAAVGIANVFNMIGAFGLVILSFSGLFVWKGKCWRAKTVKAYRYYAARQFEARPL